MIAEYEEFFKGSVISSSIFSPGIFYDFVGLRNGDPWNDAEIRSVWNQLPYDGKTVFDLVRGKSHFVFPDPSFRLWDRRQFPECPLDLSLEVRTELERFGGELPRPLMRIFAADPLLPGASLEEIGRKLPSYRPHERIAYTGSVIMLHLLDLVLGDTSPARKLPILTGPTLSLLPGRAGALPCVVDRKDGRITVSFAGLHPHMGAVLAIPVHHP